MALRFRWKSRRSGWCLFQDFKGSKGHLRFLSYRWTNPSHQSSFPWQEVTGKRTCINYTHGWQPSYVCSDIWRHRCSEEFKCSHLEAFQLGPSKASCMGAQKMCWMNLIETTRYYQVRFPHCHSARAAAWGILYFHCGLSYFHKCFWL